MGAALQGAIRPSSRTSVNRRSANFFQPLIRKQTQCPIAIPLFLLLPIIMSSCLLHPKQPTQETAAKSLAQISKWLHRKYNVFFKKLEDLFQTLTKKNLEPPPGAKTMNLLNHETRDIWSKIVPYLNTEDRLQATTQEFFPVWYAHGISHCRYV